MMKMTHIISIFAVMVAVLLSGCADNGKNSNGEWVLAWEDDFNGTIDSSSWSKIPRWHPEWAQMMSDNPVCYGIRDGNLILRGVVNPDMADSVDYITGGLYTKGKRAFHGGKIEVRARLQGAKGAWPAIWLKPFEEEKYPWPTGGEIDIMERLNHDSIAYQTVHSYYTHALGRSDNPRNGTVAPINKDGYNVYAVEMYKDSISFFINGRHSMTYPRIDYAIDGQFPFDRPYYLLVDMQLGGNWVGSVDPSELPVEMEVDWVRYYKRK